MSDGARRPSWAARRAPGYRRRIPNIVLTQWGRALTPPIFGRTCSADHGIARTRRASAEDDIKVGRKLADPGSGQGIEIHHEFFERLCRKSQGVARIGGMPLHQNLRGEDPAAVLTDRNVNVRRAEHAEERVLDGLDRAEVIVSF